MKPTRRGVTRPKANLPPGYGFQRFGAQSYAASVREAGKPALLRDKEHRPVIFRKELELEAYCQLHNRLKLTSNQEVPGWGK